MSRSRSEVGVRRWLSGAILLALSWPLPTGGNPQALPPTADDLILVDCRLSPKQKRVGGKTYPIAGKSLRTTAVDCQVRGGEYTVYDRADYKTSLAFWLVEANKGNADAQYYVGKIYEGLGTAPDHKTAAQWYAKAAAGGHSASQFVLASLYEKGLGVAEDKARALSLYRRAAGLPDDILIVERGEYEALEQAANDLALREQEIEELQRQLDEATKQKNEDGKAQRELQRQLDLQRTKANSLKTEMARIQAALKSAQSAARLTTVPGQRPIPTTTTGPSPSARANLGRFFALVIGNGKYAHLPPVPSAEHDAKAMQALLRDQYGFKVTLLLDATNAKVLSTLYALSQTLSANDNLVVFYAGHGRRDLRSRRGWWLPVDAGSDRDAKTNWLPNQEVSDRLALIAARHILVLADASYVGDITRGAPQPAPEAMTAAQWTSYVEATKRHRARLALSSGADGPLSGARPPSSRFASTLIDVLRRQSGVVPASRVHREVVNALTADDRVTSAVPTFAPLQSAFHDGVDFLFERK